MDSERVIGIAAEFHKDSGGRLELFSLTAVVEINSQRDGEVYTRKDGYDVEWSKYHKSYIFNQSSWGGPRLVEVSGIYFTSGDVEIKETPCQLIDTRDKPPWKGKRKKEIRNRNRTRRLMRLPKAFDMDGCENLLEWLRDRGIEDDAVYCSTCRDYFPGDSLWSQCEHIWWCDKTGNYSTPSDRCKCKEREECDDR